MFKQLREVFAYKQMLISTVKKDLRSRYRGSILGFLWTFINPLMQLVVYSVVFKRLLRATEDNYAMFVFTALLPWLYCVSSIQASTTCIVSNSNLVKKIYFPRMILPISVSTTRYHQLYFWIGNRIPSLNYYRCKINALCTTNADNYGNSVSFVTGLCMMLSAFMCISGT